MRPLRYSINTTLDGCTDHLGIPADEELHEYHAAMLAQADALVFGRVTYQMMEEAWRLSESDVELDSTDPFARTIHAAKKYVVSTTLREVDWNAEIISSDVGAAIRRLKAEPGNGLYVSGVQLPLALANLGLIDEYEFVVHPRLAGRGPTLFAGLANHIDLQPVSRYEFASGAVATRYVPKT